MSVTSDFWFSLLVCPDACSKSQGPRRVVSCPPMCVRVPKMAVFWSKMEFFSFRQAVETPPTILRVLEAKKQDVEAHRSQKTQFTACVCTKMCHFSLKKRPKMAVFWSKLSCFASDEQLKTPRPYFRGAG